MFRVRVAVSGSRLAPYLLHMGNLVRVRVRVRAGYGRA